MQKVEGSNPFIRSMFFRPRRTRRSNVSWQRACRSRGDVAEWLRHGSAKPATPVRLRSSPPRRSAANSGFLVVVDGHASGAIGCRFMASDGERGSSWLSRVPPGYDGSHPERCQERPPTLSSHFPSPVGGCFGPLPFHSSNPQRRETSAPQSRSANPATHRAAAMATRDVLRGEAALKKIVGDGNTHAREE